MMPSFSSWPEEYQGRSSQSRTRDTRWREFSDYGLVSAFKPAGFVGAQLSYWWLQAKDAWKDRRERAAG